MLVCGAALWLRHSPPFRIVGRQRIERIYDRARAPVPPSVPPAPRLSIALVPVPDVAHLAPMRALAEELIGRGHRVSMALPEVGWIPLGGGVRFEVTQHQGLGVCVSSLL